jgi:hypothetical protein
MTTFVPVITELAIAHVYEPGVPNKERIAIRVDAAVDLGSYAVVLGVRSPGTQFITPIRDSMFWFGSGTVAVRDWIFVYTGSGTPTTVPPSADTPGVGNVYVLYWGRPQTAFHDPQVVPVLWRISGVFIPPVSLALPQ